jgi:hypothetical protein
MMIRFIIWMIIVFIVSKILGQMIRYVRLMLTPNRDILNHRKESPLNEKKPIEDIPYEEIKDKK